MTAEFNEERRDALVTRLVTSRALLERCLSEVTSDVGMRGTEWSVGDLLEHLGESYYQDMARQFLNEESPQLDVYDPETEWKRCVEQALSRVDDALSIARVLTPKEMNRTGWMSLEPLTVLDTLALCVAHVEEHLAQLKDEIRPREGLSSA
ncbi:DinB family protein [SAR202 cluster bacterium AC-647-N09_OGT_505m]|nr:DinB family protein [SAR202 cluster bacterium AC-647-N09_OGT_505m]